MTKAEVINRIKELAAAQKITRQEVIAAYEAGAKSTSHEHHAERPSLSAILSFIGGAIVFLGIAVLIGQHWSQMSDTSRIFVTLGPALLAYFAGYVFSRNERTVTMAPAFYLIGMLVLPIGLATLLTVINPEWSSSSTNVTIFSVTLTIIFIVSYFMLKNPIFIIGSILFGTWTFFASTALLTENQPSMMSEGDLILYKVMAIGVSYLLIGYGLRNFQRSITSLLYSLGTIATLGSAFQLGGYFPDQNIFWELVYPGLVFGALLLGTRLQSNAMVLWGTLFLMGYIIKISTEYFSSNLGWPLTLVIAGLLLIGAARTSLYIRDKYMKKEN